MAPVGILTSISSSLTLTTDYSRLAPLSDIPKLPPSQIFRRRLQGKDDCSGNVVSEDGTSAESNQGSRNLQRPLSVMLFLTKSSFSRVLLYFSESPKSKKLLSSRLFLDKSSSRKEQTPFSSFPSNRVRGEMSRRRSPSGGTWN